MTDDHHHYQHRNAHPQHRTVYDHSCVVAALQSERRRRVHSRQRTYLPTRQRRLDGWLLLLFDWLASHWPVCDERRTPLNSRCTIDSLVKSAILSRSLLIASCSYVTLNVASLEHLLLGYQNQSAATRCQFVGTNDNTITTTRSYTLSLSYHRPSRRLSARRQQTFSSIHWRLPTQYLNIATQPFGATCCGRRIDSNAQLSYLRHNYVDRQVGKQHNGARGGTTTQRSGWWRTVVLIASEQAIYFFYCQLRSFIICSFIHHRHASHLVQVCMSINAALRR